LTTNAQGKLPAAGAPIYYTANGHKLPAHAQSKLPTVRLWLGAEELSTEMATSAIEEETGMMFRTNLDDNAGMIFVFPSPQRASFWMANCPLPLSAAYIDPQGEILEIHELHANDTNLVVAQSPNILFVLEVGEGWFARHHVEPGTIIRTEKGTLRETFSARSP
jgi:uncharacterized membrane protein (UPF0127 family)